MISLRQLWEHPEVLPFIGQIGLSYFVTLVLPLYAGYTLHSKDRVGGNNSRGMMLLGIIAVAAATFWLIATFPGPHVAEFGSKLGPFALMALLLGALAAFVLIGYVIGMLASFAGLKR